MWPLFFIVIQLAKICDWYYISSALLDVTKIHIVLLPLGTSLSNALSKMLNSNLRAFQLFVASRQSRPHCCLGHPTTSSKVTQHLTKVTLNWPVIEPAEPFQLNNVKINSVFGFQYCGCTALRIAMGVKWFHHVNNIAEGPSNPCISSHSNVKSVLTVTTVAFTLKGWLGPQPQWCNSVNRGESGVESEGDYRFQPSPTVTVFKLRSK